MASALIVGLLETTVNENWRVPSAVGITWNPWMFEIEVPGIDAEMADVIALV